jgi:hypothetical protein
LECDSQLSEIIGALGAADFVPGSGEGGQQQRGQNGNDGDHHQQFNQGETPDMKRT